MRNSHAIPSSSLVICNHGPYPWGRARHSHGKSGALNKVLSLQCGGNTQGLLYIGKKGSEMKKIAGCGGKQQWFYQ